MAEPLTERQRDILDVIVDYQDERGFPPSVREIGDVLGLKSPATVKAHLDKLQEKGFLERDPAKPRAICVRYDGRTGQPADRRPVHHVPLIGDVAAGTDVLAQQHFEELVPVPSDLTGHGELYMLRVRGDSMIELGILDGDYVVVRSQNTAEKGDLVIAGLPDDEATVKTYDERHGQVVLIPANKDMRPMWYDPEVLRIYGRVVTVMRRI